MRFIRAYFCVLSVSLWVAMPASGQSVVSTRAGLVHYFEGVVAINGEPLQARAGRFPEIAEGAELRTGQGHAEVLLGPGVILRVADDSALKMLSTSLANVRLELLSGAAILEAKDALPGNAVTMLHKEWQVKIKNQGVYRIDSDPAQLRIYNGEVEVRAGTGEPAVAKAGETLPLGPVLVPEQTLGPPGDGFNEWAFQRSEAIAADNATAAQIVDDPALYPNIDASGLSMAGYTYFPPTLGNPYMSYGGMYGPGTYGPGVYGSYLTSYGVYGYPYSMGRPILPGYTLRYQNPGLPGRIGFPSQPNHLPTIGGYGGLGGYRPVGGLPTTTRPGFGAPATPHPSVGVGAGHPVVHGGRH